VQTVLRQLREVRRAERTRKADDDDRESPERGSAGAILQEHERQLAA
jgi:hypothetical protein